MDELEQLVLAVNHGTEIRAPRLRAELIENLRILGDVTHQQRTWVRGEGLDPERVDNLDYALDLIFNGSQLADDQRATLENSCGMPAKLRQSQR